jgi:hypothetical protein
MPLSVMPSPPTSLRSSTQRPSPRFQNQHSYIRLSSPSLLCTDKSLSNDPVPLFSSNAPRACACSYAARRPLAPSKSNLHLGDIHGCREGREHDG